MEELNKRVELRQRLAALAENVSEWQYEGRHLTIPTVNETLYSTASSIPLDEESTSNNSIEDVCRSLFSESEPSTLYVTANENTFLKEYESSVQLGDDSYSSLNISSPNVIPAPFLQKPFSPEVLLETEENFKLPDLQSARASLCSLDASFCHTLSSTPLIRHADSSLKDKCFLEETASKTVFL